VALNKFPADTDAEIKLVKEKCKSYKANVILSEVWEKGSSGGIELAEEILKITDKEKPQMEFAYDLDMGIKEKIEKIAIKIYGADGADFSPKAAREIDNLEKLGFGRLPICIAKTQYSLTDDPAKLGRPTGFRITVRDAAISAGAGFIVALTGDIMKMPGLPKVPAAEKIDTDSNGIISGLF
jgi:formate--tetrahydrofolate ligase